MRKFLPFFFCSALLIWGARAINAQYVSTSAIPASALMKVEQLSTLLKSHHAPAMFQVGSHLLFQEAHIPGSKYIGPGAQEQGLDALEAAVSTLPKSRLIVLYCGCCPWDHCPNVGPAWQQLHQHGYSNVKVLYLPNNFGDDWVAKGYPTERQ